MTKPLRQESAVLCILSILLCGCSSTNDQYATIRTLRHLIDAREFRNAFIYYQGEEDNLSQIPEGVAGAELQNMIVATSEHGRDQWAHILASREISYSLKIALVDEVHMTASLPGQYRMTAEGDVHRHSVKDSQKSDVLIWEELLDIGDFFGAIVLNSEMNAKGAVDNTASVAFGYATLLSTVASEGKGQWASIFESPLVSLETKLDLVLEIHTRAKYLVD